MRLFALLLLLLLCSYSLCGKVSRSLFSLSNHGTKYSNFMGREFPFNLKQKTCTIAFLSLSRSSTSTSSCPYSRTSLKENLKQNNNIPFHFNRKRQNYRYKMLNIRYNGKNENENDGSLVPGESPSGEANTPKNNPAQSDIIKFNQDFSQVLLWQGSDITSNAYEGFLRNGRGGVLVNSEMKQVLESETFSVEYIPLFQLLDADYVIEGLNDDNRDNVIEQMKKYDEENEVVILFGSRGLIGCNTIKPNFPPKFIYENNRGKR